MKRTLDGLVVNNIRRLVVEVKDEGIFELSYGKPSYPQQVGTTVKIVVETDENGHYTSAELAGT